MRARVRVRGRVRVRVRGRGRGRVRVRVRYREIKESNMRVRGGTSSIKCVVSTMVRFFLAFN